MAVVYGKLLNSVTMTGTETTTSAAMKVADAEHVSFQAVWTGTPTGTITIEVSVDGVTWSALTFNPAITQPAGSASNQFVSVANLAFPEIRFKYVNSSGTGTFDVWFSAKVG